jgi:hypothetical protein
MDLSESGLLRLICSTVRESCRRRYFTLLSMMQLLPRTPKGTFPNTHTHISNFEQFSEIVHNGKHRNEDEVRGHDGSLDDLLARVRREMRATKVA